MLPKISFPTIEVTLPSTNKKITIRPMLVKEEKILLMAKEGQTDAEIFNSIRQVVNLCITSTDINVDKLTLFDIEFLFIKIRSISINNIINIGFEDKEDSQEYKFDIDLNNVKVKFPENVTNVIEINDKSKIYLKYLESRLYKDEEYLTTKDDESLDFLIMYSLDKLIIDGTEYDPRKFTKDELKEFINSLPILAYGKIRDYIFNSPRLFYEIKYTNKNDTERTITLSSLNDFFTLA